jgi:arylamine N-acetyltransferase
MGFSVSANEKTDAQILYASDRVVPYSKCALLAELEPETEFVAALWCMLASRDLRAEMSEKGLKFARSRRRQDTADENLEAYRRALNESCSPPI